MSLEEDLPSFTCLKCGCKVFSGEYYCAAPETSGNGGCGEVPPHLVVSMVDGKEIVKRTLTPVFCPQPARPRIHRARRAEKRNASDME